MRKFLLLNFYLCIIYKLIYIYIYILNENKKIEQKLFYSNKIIKVINKLKI